MNRKNIGIPLVLLLFVTTLYLTPNTQLAKAQETDIHIKADGSIIPPGTPITSLDNRTYTLITDIINSSIFVERNNITIDGAGHRLVGKGRLDVNVVGGFKMNNVISVTIQRVKISNCYWAIHMTQCDGCIIRENELTGNSYTVAPEFSNNSLMTKNRVMNNYGGAIYIASCINFTIKQNLISSNFPFAIGFQTSTNSTVTQNDIANNDGIGIRVLFSSNINVYHNNFVSNLDSAYSNSTGTWDNGYPYGGNYWSDYTGTDANHDGIGDVPYAIRGDHTDRYPLMRPLMLTLFGDINYDGTVDIIDITRLGSAYGHVETESNWIPQADLAPPYGVINMLDAVTCAAQYARKFP
jgi:parallel beta-helix repeat protein